MIGVGLSAELGGGAPQGGAMPEVDPNPNLLLWSEEMQQATWAAADAVVTANQGQDELGATTADEIAFAVGGTVMQATGIAAVAGANQGATFEPPPARERFSHSGVFDGTTYQFSAFLESATGGQIRLELLRSGGFLAVRFRDIGDETVVLVSQVKLETPTLTAYVKREGT
jgi:hypothetical protein